jgi:Tol biopolymer transport system component
MRTNISSRKKVQKDGSNLRQRFLTHLGTVILLIIGLGFLFAPQRAYGQQPETIGNGLLYLQSDSPGQSKIIHKPQPLGSEDSTIAEPFIPAGCAALGMYASPHGPWLAIDITCEASGFVQVINVASGQTVDLDANLIQDSTFLNWSPTGNEIILRVGNLPTSRVYQIQINSGRYEQLPVPGNVYDIAISTNGRRMIYSLTQGLGYGSETWISDVDGGNAQQVLLEPNHVIAFAHWSPSGNEIVYVRMPDSNIPFTIGELWIMGGNGENPSFLSKADTGHGYRPVWSPNGQYIAFVVREQYGEENDLTANEADYVPDELVSNIYMVDMQDRKILKVTQFDGALTETPVWSPDGAYLAFNTTAGGNGRDVWVLDVQNNNLVQVTHGANTRHPTWLSIP